MKIDVKKLVAWANKEELEYFNSKPDFETAWNDCPRGDWMLWLAYELDVDNELIIRTAVDCASTVRHLMSDPRSTNALDKAIEFLDGKISIEELRLATDAAYDATDDAEAAAGYAAGETAAAYAAAYVADAAYVASAAAACATHAARAAALAADTAAADAAYEENQRQTADICREYLTPAVMAAVKKLQ